MNPYMAANWWLPQAAATATAIPQTRPMISETDIQRRMYLTQVNADLRDRAVVWQEYKTPEQRLYYYNSKTFERTWNKPQVIQELDDAIAVIKEQKARKAIDEARAQEGNSFEKGDVNKVGTATNHVDEKISDDSSKKLSHTTTLSETSSATASKSQQQGASNNGRPSMKPVSTTAVPGTPWCVVWTDAGRVFYFNPSTKTSVWERPSELRGREDVDKMVSSPPISLSTSSQPKTPALQSTADDENSHLSSNSETNQSHSCQSDEKKKLETNSPSENGGSTKSDPAQTNNSTTVTPGPKIVKKNNASEVEKDAAKKRETIPYEERVKTFRDLLEEKQVDPNSTFQAQLSKIVFDPRYLLLTSTERRETFEKFCLEKTEDEQRKKREKIKAVTNEFKLLLAEANLTSRSTFDEFHEKFAKDPRYKALEKTKDREILFDDHLAFLRRKEREVRSQQQPSHPHEPHPSSHHRRSHSRHRSSSRSAPRDEAESIFHGLLVEFVTEPELTWHEAKRIMRKSLQWSYVDDLPRDWMEMVFERHLDKIYHRRKEKFLQLLSETKEVTLSSDWRDIKRVIRDDPRYIKFSTSDRRCEREFRDFIKKKRTTAEESFKQLLCETKLIDCDTRRKIEESEHQHLIDIIGFLQNDKRYTDLEPFSEDRRKILLSYIEELAVKGSGIQEEKPVSNIG